MHFQMISNNIKKSYVICISFYIKITINITTTPSLYQKVPEEEIDERKVLLCQRWCFRARRATNATSDKDDCPSVTKMVLTVAL